VSHDTQICVSRKQFLSADSLFTVHFAETFQTKAEKPLYFSYRLAQDYQSAVEAKLLCRTMRTATEKVVTKAKKAIIAAM